MKIGIFLGSGSGMARLGAMATPYVAQVMLLHSVSLAIIVYTVLGNFYEHLYVPPILTVHINELAFQDLFCLLYV